jgi:hypothetical protein
MDNEAEGCMDNEAEGCMDNEAEGCMDNGIEMRKRRETMKARNFIKMHDHFLIKNLCYLVQNLICDLNFVQ